MAFITKYLNQTAVHWPTPTKDGFGKLTYGTAVEISVRWEEKNELFLNQEGKQQVSRAIVYVDRDMVIDEYLYLGELTDLSTQEKSNPNLEVYAYSIKGFKKSVSINGTEYVRKVWL